MGVHGNPWSSNDIHGYPLVAGVSTPSKAINVPMFRTAIAYMQGKAVGNQNGYETIYSITSSVPGMSGGGLFGGGGLSGSFLSLSFKVSTFLIRIKSII